LFILYLFSSPTSLGLTNQNLVAIVSALTKGVNGYGDGGTEAQVAKVEEALNELQRRYLTKKEVS
jgi:hypothetical protein